MKLELTPDTIRHIETAINRRETSEVRLKVERGEITVLAVQVRKIE